MKSTRGRIIRKLKSISTITSLKQGTVFWDNLSNHNLQTSTLPRECEGGICRSELVGGSTTVSQIIKDVQEEEEEELVLGHCGNDKTEFRPSIKSEDKLSARDHFEDTEEYGSDSACTLAQSDRVKLLAESQTHRLHNGPFVETGVSALQALDIKIESLSNSSTTPANFKLTAMEECTNSKAKEYEDCVSLRDFEEKCPPGGSESVVLYTTSLKGIRKTFEDCSTIRFLLGCFRVVYDERDVSMHLEYREELWRILGRGIVPPRLFIGGRHIGGADEVVGLHERGILRKLLQGIPLIPSNSPCNGCAGVRFVLCFNCSGSRKITPEGQGGEPRIRCLECNENGLVKCPICSLK